MLRTYKVKHCANKTKINKVVDTLKEYRTAAEKIAGRQWYLFFAEGGFNKNANIKDVNTALSERYKKPASIK